MILAALIDKIEVGYYTEGGFMMNYPFSRPALDLNAWSEVTRSLMDAAEEIRTEEHTPDELRDLLCL